MPSNVVEEWLERWISPEVRLGNRVVSSWFLAGAAGFMAGWILLVVLAAWSGASLGVAVLIGMAAATAAAVGGIVERAVLG
ncbi:MAG TPA: hypothetical protein PKA64_23615, partial [Myxococcota bacterium]|nr:hypothetical protein [Myxococcota bacterium]